MLRRPLRLYELHRSNHILACVEWRWQAEPSFGLEEPRDSRTCAGVSKWVMFQGRLYAMRRLLLRARKGG